MRLRLSIITQATEIPWDMVQTPGSDLAYTLLAEQAQRAGGQPRDGRIDEHHMVPFGHSAPVFPYATRRRGVYTTGGQGWVELGSPMPAVAEAFLAGLTGRDLLDWGGVALRVTGVRATAPPDFSDGRAIFRTLTPVVMEDPGRGAGTGTGEGRPTRQAWLLPHDPEFALHLTQNLRCKAATLGLGDAVRLEEIIFVGAKRSFAMKSGRKIGAPIAARISGEPAILRAIWSWGLGQANSAGFGWIAP